MTVEPTNNASAVAASTPLPSLVLGARRQAVLDYIQQFIAERHYPPTLREIGKGVGITTTSLVKYHLDRLERDGLIGRDAAVPRGLWLVS
jgi:repressor LexA